jgi:hypothetical protein
VQDVQWTGITVNMDNYYTSTPIMILLCNRGFFARDTVLKNRFMVPSHIILTRSETANLPGGYLWMAVCEFAKMLVLGCNNKNPVHFVSTADGSEARATVWHQRKKLVANVS